MTNLHNGKVKSIEPGSIAEEAEIEPGDLIVSLNDHRLSDVIDYRFYSAEEDVDILVRRGDDEAVISVEKDIDEPLGIEFEDELFDGVRTCGNRCVFCFVRQLPKGMRQPLYIRDDDFRLSFLHGNFVTLTNLSESDLQRIIEQRLSPLYVSVHSTEPELRKQMIGGKESPDVMDQLRRLAEGGIALHTQIVVCPSLNDGLHLDRTVRDLSGLYPAVVSIGVVPVGLTKHKNSRYNLVTIDAEGARQIVRLVLRRQRMLNYEKGTRLVWASDELYLVSGTTIPTSATYEGYPQYENGIGIVRSFLDDARDVGKWLPERAPHPFRATLVTGMLAAPVLADFADTLNRVDGIEIRVAPIKNEFFGETVTVTGLLTGADVARQLSGRDLGVCVILPSVMLRDGAFLDDVTVQQMEQTLGTSVIVVEPTPTALVKAAISLSEQ